jgi:hypothetical protein
MIACLSAAALAVAPFAVFAHGNEGGMMGSGSRGEMMTLMHNHLDENAAINCDSVTDETLMEHGEELMEAMVGKEDHERIEKAMEEDMHDHDAMHMMLGMMATGCVGDEVGATLAARYTAPKARTGSTGMFTIGLIGGLVLGFLGAGFFRKKSVPVAMSPSEPSMKS